ncbi:MAG: hypothetical protein HFJ50_07555 [Clostridia bacterium]|jgi:hypothetical protein|nr:hypothetical protein [Clostridia bacterium]
MKAIFKSIFETRHSAKTLVSMILIGQLLIAIFFPMVLSIAKYGISNANIQQYEIQADEVAERNCDRTYLDEQIRELKREQKVIAEFDTVFAWCLRNSESKFSAFMRDCQVIGIILSFLTGIVLLSGGVHGVIENTMYKLNIGGKEEEEIISTADENPNIRVILGDIREGNEKEPTSAELFQKLLDARDSCYDCVEEGVSKGNKM